MRIAITGGAGFLGTELARRLLAAEAVAVGGAAPAPVDELVLVDLAPPRPELLTDPRVATLTGDLEQTAVGLGDADLVLHLAGVVSGAAEADFDLGMRTNVDGLRAVLEACRAMATPPVLVFTSSLAVFGSDPALAPLETVDDDTLPRPQSSYGIQKLIGEQLVTDYTRKGFLRGRSVRLMTVAVRPGAPNAAASGFLSGIIREPLAGLPAVCPVPPDTPVALSSPRRTLDGIQLAASAAGDAWGSTTALTLPALTTTPRAMADALERAAGPDARALIEWTEDPAIRPIVESWPARIVSARAAALGLEPEPDFDAIIAQYRSGLPAA